MDRVRPKAGAETVQDLVARVLRGEVRIPAFQRSLKWDATDVINLYDSLYKGYPVGTLLLHRRKAPAAKLKLGPLQIEAPELAEALWVVDGQQRLVSLAAGLARPVPIPTVPEDPYVVYFDAAERRFVPPTRKGEIPSTWVPLPRLLDASDLNEWIFTWPHAQDPSMRRAVFEAGRNVREYNIPQYVVIDANDEAALREMFYRTNTSGKPMEWTDVHTALYGSSTQPSTLEDLGGELAQLGMGRPSREQLLTCVIAHLGLDVTQNLSVHSRTHGDNLQTGVPAALPAIRSVFSFFRLHAEIPHLRLLPRSMPLTILTRFFTLFPAPQARTLQLLIRWTWRTLLGATDLSTPTFLRRSITQMRDQDEERATQMLLALTKTKKISPFQLPAAFDARSAESRLCLLGLVSLKPCDLETGSQLNVAELIEQHDRDAFRRVWQKSKSPANRVLLPRRGLAQADLRAYCASQPDPKVLRSHGIDEDARQALLQNDQAGFISARGRLLEQIVTDLVTRLSGRAYSDRSTIQHILSSVSAE